MFNAGLFTLFVFDTVGFWILFVIVSCFLIGFLEYRRGGWATFTLILTLFLLYKFGNLRFAGFADHPWKLGEYLGGYIIVGVLWAIFEWWRFVVRLAHKCEDFKMEFLRRHKIVDSSVIPDHLKEEWRGAIESYGGRAILGLQIDTNGIVPPHPNDHKEAIYLWMIFWPWSMLWFVIDEPIRKLFRTIYRSIRGFLVSISERAFKDIKADFAEPPASIEKPVSKRRSGVD